GPVDKLPFREVFRDRDFSSPSNESVQLSEQQFKALVKVLFTYGVHYDEVLEQQRPLFMKSILDDQLNFFGLSLTFCEHLMNNLDETTKAEFNELQNMQWNLDNPLSNEQLIDFVEMEVIDPIVSYRKWEYGRYALEHLSSTSFKAMDWDNQKKIVRSGKINIQEYFDALDNKMPKSNFELDEHEKTLMQLVIKSNLEPKKMSLVEYLLASEIIQSNFVGLNLRMKRLQESLNYILRNQRSEKKGRGGQKI
ncbi:MAG: hypothetical protein AAF969_13370, partial [Bacteroidota bacterium]